MQRIEVIIAEIVGVIFIILATAKVFNYVPFAGVMVVVILILALWRTLFRLNKEKNAVKDNKDINLKCSKCGAENLVTDNYCQKCGNKLIKE
jgi:ribosomal protein L40E